MSRKFDKVNILIGVPGGGKSEFLRGLADRRDLCGARYFDLAALDCGAIRAKRPSSDFDFMMEYAEAKRNPEFTVKFRQFMWKFGMSGMVGDGAIRMMVVGLLLLGSDCDTLALDASNVNWHPSWQKQLAMEIQWCTNVNQIFISTHSPDFLDEFTEGFLEGRVGVFVFDPREKDPIRKLDRSELAGDLKDFTLGDLYRVGDPMIGGWPL